MFRNLKNSKVLNHVLIKKSSSLEIGLFEIKAQFDIVVKSHMLALHCCTIRSILINYKLLYLYL